MATWSDKGKALDVTRAEYYWKPEHRMPADEAEHEALDISQASVADLTPPQTKRARTDSNGDMGSVSHDIATVATESTGRRSNDSRLRAPTHRSYMLKRYLSTPSCSVYLGSSPPYVPATPSTVTTAATTTSERPPLELVPRYTEVDHGAAALVATDRQIIRVPRRFDNEERRVYFPVFEVTAREVAWYARRLSFDEYGYPVIEAVGHMRGGGYGCRYYTDYHDEDTAHENLYRHYRAICVYMRFLELHACQLRGFGTQREVAEAFVAWGDWVALSLDRADGTVTLPDGYSWFRPVSAEEWRRPRGGVTDFFFPTEPDRRNNARRSAAIKRLDRVRNIGLCFEYLMEECGVDVRRAIGEFKNMQRQISETVGIEANLTRVQDHLKAFREELQARHNSRLFSYRMVKAHYIKRIAVSIGPQAAFPEETEVKEVGKEGLESLMWRGGDGEQLRVVPYKDLPRYYELPPISMLVGSGGPTPLTMSSSPGGEAPASSRPNADRMKGDVMVKSTANPHGNSGVSYHYSHYSYRGLSTMPYHHHRAGVSDARDSQRGGDSSLLDR